MGVYSGIHTFNLEMNGYNLANIPDEQMNESKIFDDKPLDHKFTTKV